jgi:hypothetical protein
MVRNWGGNTQMGVFAEAGKCDEGIGGLTNRVEGIFLLMTVLDFVRSAHFTLAGVFTDKPSIRTSLTR